MDKRATTRTRTEQEADWLLGVTFGALSKRTSRVTSPSAKMKGGISGKRGFTTSPAGGLTAKG